jgi:iron-sulfur cluster insertion protein
VRAISSTPAGIRSDAATAAFFGRWTRAKMLTSRLNYSSIIAANLWRGKTMSQPATALSTPDLDAGDMRLTPAAQAQMADLLRQADEDFAGIRVFVAGGGCGGMGYGMTFAESITSYDRVVEGPGYKVVVDAVALNYLQGCEVDFVEDGVNSTFVFNNVFRSVGGSGTCGGCGGGGGCGAF